MTEFFRNFWTVISKGEIAIGLIASLGIGGALLYYFDWSTSIPSIASAVIAAVLIGITARAINILKVQPRLRKFREFFGYNKNDGRDIFVVVPFFKTKTGSTVDETKTQYLYPENQSTPSEWLEEQKHIETGLQTLAAFEDLRSAASLSSLFAEQDGIAPKIVPDSDWDEERVRGGRTYTAIAVGLFSNKVSRKFYHATFSDPIGAFVSINPLKESTSGGQIKIRTRTGSEDVRTWTSFSDPMLAAPKDGSPVHAVIVKVIDKKSGCIGFIVGGLSEYGTSHAGRFLREEWEKIYDFTDENGEKIGSRAFAIVLSVQVNRKQEIEPVISTHYICEEDKSFSLRKYHHD
ncbi:MAG: hypothetical protein AB2704_26025 [Candidatus Thiodiazotropha taylori]